MTVDKASQERRNISRTRKNWVKVEQFLTDIERSQGVAKAWTLRQRLERGQVTLEELCPR